MKEEDLNKHKEAFLNEAQGYVNKMNAILIELEKTPGNVDQFHELYRAVHTLKSMSATMQYIEFSKLCHAIEDLLETIKTKKMKLGKCIDVLFECIDFIKMLLGNIEAGKEEENASVPIKKIFVCINEKLTKKKQIFTQETARLHAGIEKVKSIEVKANKLDALLNLVEELLINKMKLEGIEDSLQNAELTSTVQTIGRVISELQYHIMQIRMVQIGFVFNQFLRMSRDLAKQQDKLVVLNIRGADIGLDRSIVDEISESLVHLVRNAIDHGLEPPDVREKLNKPAQGEIKLSASRIKDFVHIEISDDGQGVDYNALKKQGLQNKLITENATLDEIHNLIFSGLSTSKSITSVSGRGLGLDIVKQKIESIGGTIRVHSSPNKGTTFSIEVPHTLAVVKALFVKVRQRIYAIPVANIERVVISEQDTIKNTIDQEAIILENQEVPIIRLQKLFGGKNAISIKQPTVIVRREEEKLGLTVDELMTTEEVVIKPLNPYINESKHFSGSAMIGSGEIVLILDIAQLFSMQPVVKRNVI